MTWQTKLADVKLEGRYSVLLSMRLNPVVSTFLPYLEKKATTNQIQFYKTPIDLKKVII